MEKSKEILAITILGWEKNEQKLIGVLLDLVHSNEFGEIPGSNIRLITDLTKEQLFDLIERLVQRNVFKYMSSVPINTVYIVGGEGSYVFNSNYREWLPTNDSPFYKLCKIYGLRFNNASYNYLLDNMDLRIAIEKKSSQVDKGITPYEIYDLFCQLYHKHFNAEYSPLNQYKDFLTLKNIICKFSYENIEDRYVKEFINWCFMVKIRDFKQGFIIGFLPMCLKDYLGSNVVEKIKPGYTKDFDGRLRKQ
jgi:hypothetical protein